MKYTVRTKEGELTYDSFGAVERAWLQGLVEPDDEVLEEGTTKWRKAGSIPLLAQARRYGNQVWGGAQLGLLVVYLVLGSVALYGLTSGSYYVGVIAAAILAVVTVKISMRAFKLNKPHR